MPTLVRFLTIVAVLAAVVYGAMLVLVATVTPRQAEISVRVPLDALERKP